jgi:serine/threonine-protein kinase
VSAGAVLAGRTGGSYRLDELIAHGRHGDTWRGVDTTTDGTVAVKTLHPREGDTGDLDSAGQEEWGFLKRLEANCRGMPRLRHPSLVTFRDFGWTPGIGAYLVREYVAGTSLWDLLRHGRLGAPRSMRLIAQAAAGLVAAHEFGVYHSDLHPANLLVCPDDTLLVNDAGLVRLVMRLPPQGEPQLLGRPPYLSPEEAMFQTPSRASDVFALGVVAHHCLAGRPPWTGETPMHIALSMIREPPAPLPDDVPDEVRTLVASALVTKPADRLLTMAGFAVAARDRSASGA